MRIIALLVVLAVPAHAVAQTPAPSKPSATSAYYEFLLARHLESQGDAAGALAALERARTLDPKSAEIPAEIAGYYARQNKGDEAVREAEAALALDAGNSEAHRILGLVFAAWADGVVPPPNGRSPASLRASAIEHLTKVLETPSVATDLNLQLTLARLQLRSNRPADALPILEGIVSQAPFAPEPYGMLADALVATGNLDRAAEALAQAAEIDPRYYVSLGELQERRRDYAAAAAAYEQAAGASRGGNRELSLRWIGALLNVPNGGGAAKARELLTALLTQNPQDTRALYLLSTANRDLGDRSAAEAAARELLKIDPSSLSALYALAQMEAEQHDYRGVITLLEPFSADVATRARGREADAALLLVQLGVAHQQLGAHDAAIAAFTRARDLQPASGALTGYMVQSYLAARQFEKANELAAAALQRFPDDERIMRLRAEAVTGAGRPEEGLKILQQAVEQVPESRELVVALADHYSDRKQYDEAVKVITTAAGRLGEDDMLTMQLGAVLEGAGRLDDAEKAFRRIIDRDPENAGALNYLGYMLADRGQRLPEAVQLIEKALELDPENPSYLDSLGWALFRQGKPREAEAPLRKAADTLRDSSVIQQHFGDVLAALGRQKEAVVAWERALAGDGDVVDRAALEKKIKDAGRRR